MKPKKILIDAKPLLLPATGIGRYTYEVACRMEKEDIFESDFFYGYYSKKLFKPSEQNSVKKASMLLTKNQYVKKVLRKAVNLVGRVAAPQYDLYWQPSFIPSPVVKASKVVTTVHDFSFILHKEFQPKERIEHFEKNFFKNLYRSDKIITGSEFTKKEILERTSFREDQVEVIYHGIDHKLFKPCDDLDVEITLPDKFILSVGSIEPRKNLMGLLEAYNALAKELKEEYHLVLVGFKGWENKEIMKLIDANKSYVHYLGYVSDYDLVKVYNLASLFIYPSFYEGFGLPPLEAMACGTPVIISDVSSLPEVGGDATVYCNPYDVEDISKKISLVLENTQLQQKMSLAGIQRASLFTWEKSAKKHMQLFQEVIGI